MKGHLTLAVAVGALALAAVAPAASGDSTGSLPLNAVLAMTSTPSTCPENAPPGATLCATRIGDGVVRGLGRVSESYTFFVDETHACGSGFTVLETTVRLDVAGKGQLQLALERDRNCVPSALVLNRAFTVVGGTGIYARASGSGTVRHNAHYTLTGAAGNDTFTGTLAVPGLEFDLTPPALSGAVNRVTRVRKGLRRVRVAYKVTAADAVDGTVPVSCRPRSGSRFKLGRTKVHCSATDGSGNTQSAHFTVRVKRRR
jgi:hypothetical protein